MSENTNIENTQELSELLQVRRDKLSELQNEGKDPFQITKFERSHTSSEIKDNYTTEKRELTKRGSDEVEIIDAKISALDGQNVTVAGRIMSKRGMGKVGFIHISDMDGQIQIFVKKDILGEDEYNRFKKLDLLCDFFLMFVLAVNFVHKALFQLFYKLPGFS